MGAFFEAVQNFTFYILHFTFFTVFGTGNCSTQDPSTDARDDKDDFYFQRSFDACGFAALTQDDRAGGHFVPQDDKKGAPSSLRSSG